MAEGSSTHQIKMLAIGLLIIFGLVVVMMIVARSAIYICYSDEIKTVRSVHKISERPVVEINYTGDYKFKEYLRQGSVDLMGTEEFLRNNLCLGLESILSDGYKCSAFSAQTPEGDYILAKNMDYNGSTFPAILKINTKGIIRSIGISSFNSKQSTDTNTLMENFEVMYTPYLTYDGMNEYGLSIAAISTSNSISIAKKHQTSIYDIEAVRLMLDQAKSVEDARKLIEHYNIALSEDCPSHFIICDANGDSMVIEYVHGSLQITETEKPYQILTDFLLYTGEKMSDAGAEIYNNYNKALNACNGKISEEDAMQLLKANTEEGKAQWSVVYNMSKRTLTVSFSEDNNQVYQYSF